MNINTLSARFTATQALKKVEASMSLLELTAKDGFAPQLLETLPRTKTLYLSFEDLSTHITLSRDPLFDKARETLSTRLSDISTLCRPHQPGLPGAVPAVVSASFPHPHPIKVSMPKFDGKMLHWRSFWSLFDAIMKKNPHLTPESQRVLLLEAMDSPEATELAREALSYEGAAARLRKNYENDTELHTHHVTCLLQPETFKNTRSDLKKLLHRIEKHTEGIRSSNGYTLDQVLATHLSTLLSPPLLSEWKKKSGKLTTPPDLPLFQTFIEDQIHASADPSDMKVDEDLPVVRKKPAPKVPTKAAFSAK